MEWKKKRGGAHICPGSSRRDGRQKRQEKEENRRRLVGRKLRVVQRTKEGDLERSSSRIEPESRWICAAAAAAAAGYSIVGVLMSAGLNIYILHTQSLV